MRPYIGSVAQEPAALGPGSGRSPSKFKGRLNHSGSGRSDPGLFAQFGFSGIAQAPQIAQLSHQISSDFDDIPSLAAAADKDREKLCVGERSGPVSQQPFSRTGIRRKSQESRHKVSAST
jgi:hypothetical protein